MVSPDQVMLVVEGGPNDNQEIPLAGPTAVMGRQPSNDVVVAETGVSRQHAEIASTDEGFRLRDLSSTNGTYVNSNRIEEEGYLLKDGDKIRLGASKVLLVFRSPTAFTQALTLETSAESGEEAWVVKETYQPPETKVIDENAGPGEPSKEQEVYEGTVRLSVSAEDNVGPVVSFVQQLRERPEFRISRMASNREGGTDIWLGLREPLSLPKILGAMKGVAEVTVLRDADLTPGSDDTLITVMLST